MIRVLLDRLFAWLGYVRADAPREFPRYRMGDDAIQRGERWEAFYREEGGVADMLGSLQRAYFEAYSALGYGDSDKRFEYALADRLVRELDREVRAVIETGKIRAAEAEAVRRAQLTR